MEGGRGVGCSAHIRQLALLTVFRGLEAGEDRSPPRGNALARGRQVLPLAAPTFIASSAAVTSAMLRKALWRPQITVLGLQTGPAVLPLKALGTGQRREIERSSW